MFNPLLRVLAAGSLFVATLLTFVTAAPNFVPAVRPAPEGPPAAVQPQFTTPSAAGVGDYFGGTNLGGSFQLPLVRTDTAGSIIYDTVLHTADATAGSTTVTVTFYNQDGSTHGSPVTQALAAWASWDLDVGQQLGAGFNGSATVTAAPNGIAVTVDVIAATPGATDNLDTYAGIPAGATSAFIPLAFQSGGYITQFYIRNPNATSASVTLTFWQDGTNEGSNQATVNALGGAILTVNQSNFYAGPVQVTATQPVAVIAETSGNGFYTLAPMAIPSTASTFYLPRFDYNTDTVHNLTSNLLVLNTTPSTCTTNCAASYTASFYDVNGTLVTSITANTNGVKPMRDWPLGSIGAFTDNQTPTGLTSPFVGSVVLSNPNGFPIVPLLVTLQGSFSSKTSVSITTGSVYLPVTGSPTGAWGYLPGLRKGVAGESTGFTLMNTQTTSQDYQITYWSTAGSPLRTDTFSLKPNQAWYASQAADALSPGAVFSAQVQNISNGGIPPTLIQLYAGSYTPPIPPAVASPTPFATVPPLPTFTAIPSSTLSPTSTETTTPSPTPSLTPSPTATTTTTTTATATKQPATEHSIYLPDVLSSAASVSPLPSWLVYLNGYRAMARLPSVIENALWSTGATHHSVYMVKNNLITHVEDPANAWYTADGAFAGLYGDLFTSSSQATTSTAAIDSWMAAPFHALWILYPGVSQVGFGIDAEPTTGIQMAATLQFTDGTPFSVPNSIAYPVEWPGNGTSVALTSYTGGESPDPLSSCPGYSTPTGLPLYVQFSGSAAQVTSFSLLQNSVPVAACAFDQTSYVNPDPTQQSTARAILQQGNAVVVIPSQPLVSGATYLVTVATSSQVAAWSFQVTPP